MERKEGRKEGGREERKEGRKEVHFYNEDFDSGHPEFFYPEVFYFPPMNPDKTDFICNLIRNKLVLFFLFKHIRWINTSLAVHLVFSVTRENFNF